MNKEPRHWFSFSMDICSLLIRRHLGCLRITMQENGVSTEMLLSPLDTSMPLGPGLCLCPQVTQVIPAIGCHYFLTFRHAHGYLSSRRTSPPNLAGTILHCLVTEAHVCEQLARSRYMKVERQEVEPATS